MLSVRTAKQAVDLSKRVLQNCRENLSAASSFRSKAWNAACCSENRKASSWEGALPAAPPICCSKSLQIFFYLIYLPLQNISLILEINKENILLT